MKKYLVILPLIILGCKSKTYHPPIIIQITDENEVFLDTTLTSSWLEFSQLLETKTSYVHPDLLKIKINVNDNSEYSKFKRLMKILRKEPKNYMVGFIYREDKNYYGLSSNASIENDIKESSETYEVGINNNGNYYLDSVEYKDIESFESDLIFLSENLRRIEKPENRITIIINGSDNAQYIDVLTLNENVNEIILNANKKMKELNESPMEYIYLTQVYD